MHRAPVVRIVVALTGAAVFAQAALAGGEPKNQPPFTRLVAQQRSVDAAPRPQTEVHGEPKNEKPFTRRIAP
jgi:hypothetical protein